MEKMYFFNGQWNSLTENERTFLERSWWAWYYELITTYDFDAKRVYSNCDKTVYRDLRRYRELRNR